MKIKLYEAKTMRTLTIELCDGVGTFSVEIQPGLIYKYDEKLNLIQIEVQDQNLIDPILNELQELLKNSDIKIIRKVA